jgi:hypothetical protein
MIQNPKNSGFPFFNFGQKAFTRCMPERIGNKILKYGVIYANLAWK